MASSGIVTSTARLNIIKFNPEDAAHCAFLVKLWNTPLFIASCGKTGIEDSEKAKSFIENRIMKEYARNGYGNYLLILKGSDQLIGTVALTKGDSPDSYSVPDLGFCTLPELNGKGIATEASKALMAYARQELGVNDVFGFCDPGNKASRKVLEKSGLQFRGIEKLAAFGGVNGAVYAVPHMDEDLTIYGLKN